MVAMLLWFVFFVVASSSSSSSLLLQTLSTKKSHPHLLDNLNIPIQPPHARTWTPQLVDGCRMSSGAQTIFAVEMRTPQFGNVWERQFRISSLPTEIQSRVRCQGWGSDWDAFGGPGPTPPTPQCVVDPRYYVGSKRTMLAATLGLRDYTLLYHANFLILGLGGGSQPMQLRNLFPLASISVVEIDKDDVALAKKCFGLSSDKHIRVHIDEASSFVRASASASTRNTPFDMIINDIPNPIFSMWQTSLYNLDRAGVSKTLPGQDSLHSLAFFTNIVRLLHPSHGVFLMNQKLSPNVAQSNGHGTFSRSNTDVLAVVEMTMKKAGFKSIKSLVNPKVNRAIIIGSVNKEETFDHLKAMLVQNCKKLHLDLEHNEHWRNVDLLIEELGKYLSP